MHKKLESILFLFILFTYLVKCVSFIKEDGVLVLTEDNFGEALVRNKYHLIYFYDNDAASQALYKEFEKAAQSTEVSDSKLVFAKVDVTSNKKLSRGLKIKIIPYIILFVDESDMEYTGGFSFQEIIYWYKTYFRVLRQKNGEKIEEVPKSTDNTEITFPSSTSSLSSEDQETSKNKESYTSIKSIDYSADCELPVLDRTSKIELTTLPIPFKTAKLLRFNSHGWLNRNQMVPLKSIIENNHSRRILDIRPWMGQSTIFFADMTPDNAEVWAVDEWSREGQHRQVLLDNLYDQFLSNIIQLDYTHKVKPLRKTVAEAVKYFTEWGIKFDLIFIDSPNDKTSMKRDLNDLFPLLTENGMLTGDDFQWNNFSIGQAIIEFAQEKNMFSTTNGIFWYLSQKPPMV